MQTLLFPNGNKYPSRSVDIHHRPLDSHWGRGFDVHRCAGLNLNVGITGNFHTRAGMNFHLSIAAQTHVASARQTHAVVRAFDRDAIASRLIDNLDLFIAIRIV